MLRLCFATLGFICLNYAAFAERDAAYTFAYEVRPILAKHCFQCHGPNEKHRKADMRLDVKEGIFGGEEGEHPVVPGDAAASLVWQRLTTADPDDHMPPLETGKALTEEELAKIKAWIDGGAAWSEHWSFVKPQKLPLPEVQTKEWPRNPIDNFTLARMEAEGLSPSPQANKTTLIRRVSLDLTGLPPTPEEVSDFLNDDSDDAYSKVVDRLLASPRYGERWARMWLDLARYADTKGYEKDLGRTMWPYRDWVIRAYNADTPYDEFTREQLAGDLLPDATQDQKLATAFHRNTMCNDEGGTDDEEFRTVAVKDRVDTTGQVWLGLSVGCAQCHNHVYDPISIKEYYQFFAFFNQTEDADRFDEMPLMDAPTAEETAKREALKSEIDELEEVQKALLEKPEFRHEMRDWEARVRPEKSWTTLKAVETNSEARLTLQTQEDGTITATGDQYAQDTYTIKLQPGAATITAIRLEVLADESLPAKGPGHAADGNFVLSHFSATVHKGDSEAVALKFSGALADYSQGGYEVEKSIGEGDIAVKGWAVAGAIGKDHQAYFILETPLHCDADTTLEVKLEQRFSQAAYLLGRFRLSYTVAQKGLDTLNIPDDLAAIAHKAEPKRDEGEQQRLKAYFAKYSTINAEVRDKIQDLRKQFNEIQVTRVPVMEKLRDDKRRTTHIQERGNFLSPGEEVQAAVFAAFQPMPADAQPDRLGLANWLCSTDNPLTARVAVNRHWAQFFGRGIVETEENFGAQGALPTHPELLDWLVVDFMDHGWSFKSLCRTIVLSATYQQESTNSTEQLAKDPYNLLLARGPRFRLEAELMRDNALAVAGLLSPKMYGPSVMPPQPDGIWQSTYNTQSWETSIGEDRYRRGLYTYMKRTSPYPAMLTFDAPSREICTARRIRTNTPLQALVTLNDPVYIEAAQAFARRIVSEAASPALKDRITLAYQLAVSRKPTAFEIRTLSALLESRLAHYRTAPEEAAKMATDPLGPLPDGMDTAELAAWTAVCNVILNLDEVLIKG